MSSFIIIAFPLKAVRIGVELMIVSVLGAVCTILLITIVRTVEKTKVTGAKMVVVASEAD